MEPKLLTLEICAGTACYVLGASEILALEGELHRRYPGRLSVTGVSCLESCRAGIPPVVRIDGELLFGASPALVLERVGELLGKEVPL